MEASNQFYEELLSILEALDKIVAVDFVKRRYERTGKKLGGQLQEMFPGRSIFFRNDEQAIESVDRKPMPDKIDLRLPYVLRTVLLELKPCGYLEFTPASKPKKFYAEKIKVLGAETYYGILKIMDGKGYVQVEDRSELNSEVYERKPTHHFHHQLEPRSTQASVNQ